MICEENLEKVCIYTDSCNDCINIKERALENNIATLVYCFNGTKYEHEIELKENQDIVIPNIFNENYKHKAKIILSDGTIFKNILFIITVFPCVKKGCI